MKRVLFVDDETNVLDGLRRLLRPHRHEWEMVFASGGAEAIDALAKEPFDVVVTDMRMPKIDGAALLRHAQKQHAGVVRIVLSGHTELEAALRAVPVAHQFLVKPCDPARLREAIERACNLQTLLARDEVRHAVASVGSLPSAPKVHAAVTAALADPKSSLDSVAALVERDGAMTAKILQLVNSAFFGLPRRVATVRQAINLLGTNMLKNLVLSVEVFSTLSTSKALVARVESLQRHSLMTGALAMAMLRETGRVMGEDAYMAGLLHDIGTLVFVSQLHVEHEKVIAQARAQGVSIHQAELSHFGASHAEVGGYLLGVWGLPYPIVEAVAHHHEPTRAPPAGFGVLGAVYVSQALTDVVMGPDPDQAPVLDETYLASCGVSARVPEWLQMAKNLVSSVEEAAA